jgi:hypothetical protein
LLFINSFIDISLFTSDPSIKYLLSKENTPFWAKIEVR